MEEKLPIYKLTMEDLDFDGVDKISLVAEAANMTEFMKFNKQQKVKLTSLNEEQRIITGLVIAPNVNIYRNDGINEWYVYFDEQTVKEMSQQFLMQNKQSSVNIEHSEPVNDVVLVEQWLVADSNNDKAVALGFEDVIPGSWYASFKVNNDSVWNMVKDGAVRGLSLEGLFSIIPTGEYSFNKQDKDLSDSETIEIIKGLLS